MQRSTRVRINFLIAAGLRKDNGSLPMEVSCYRTFDTLFARCRKSPGFTMATVLTLGLGIGANSAIFSVLDGVLLRPLPFDRGGRLVEVNARDAQGQRQYVSQPDLDDWRAMSRSFSGLASWVPQSVNLTGLDQPERVTGMFVSANFPARLLAVAQATGRGFATGEDRTGGGRCGAHFRPAVACAVRGGPGVPGKNDATQR